MAISRASKSSILQGTPKSRSMLDGNPFNIPLAPGSYESIATITVAAGNTSSTITFSSIPSTYDHLQLRAIYRSASSNVYNAWFTGRLNGDTGTNYSHHSIGGNGSSVGTGGYANNTALDGFSRPGVDAGDTFYGAFVMDILDYANTSKFKTTRHIGGADIAISTTRLDVGLFSNNWRSTSAVNEISFIGNQGAFTEYSHFALYGIKS
jgi:hypothetical protein